MGKTLKYVKDFDFNAKPCNYSKGGDVKMASGGYYSKGGSCGDVKMASGGYYSKGGRMAAGGATGSPPQDPAYQAVRKAAKAATSPENLRTRLAQFGQPQATPLAKGGAAKAKAAKIGKVMGEYKSGELHSGSKKGPVVKNRKQAIAIAMSEAGKSKNRA